jgi:hypothetical protein
MLDHAVTEGDPLLLGQQLNQVLLDLLRTLLRGEPQPPAQSDNVSVDHDPRRNREGGPQDDIGRLSSDAWELDQLFEGVWHLPTVVAHQRFTAGLDVLGLVAEEARALNVVFEFGRKGLGIVGRGGVLAE